MKNKDLIIGKRQEDWNNLEHTLFAWLMLIIAWHGRWNICCLYLLHASVYYSAPRKCLKGGSKDGRWEKCYDLRITSLQIIPNETIITFGRINLFLKNPVATTWKPTHWYQNPKQNWENIFWIQAVAKINLLIKNLRLCWWSTKNWISALCPKCEKTIR